MSVRSRVEKKIAKHGEDFTINGTVAARGIFQVLDSGKLHIYFDDTEVLTVGKPAYSLIVPDATVIVVDNTIVRDGRTLVVRKVEPQRVGGVSFAKLVLLA